MEHLYVGVKRECPKKKHFQKTSVPRDPGRNYTAFYDLSMEVLEHHFQHSPWVKTVTSPLRFKRRRLRTSYIPPLWGMARSHCRKTCGMGEVFAAIFGKCNPPGKWWVMWGYKNTQSSGKNWRMNRESQYNKINFKVVISPSFTRILFFPFDKSHHIKIFSFIVCLLLDWNLHAFSFLL